MNSPTSTLDFLALEAIDGVISTLMPSSMSPPAMTSPSSTAQTKDTPAPHLPSTARLGVVVIGRNEGERLERCLRSLLAQVSESLLPESLATGDETTGDETTGGLPIIYVDSGSTDGSVALAQSLGVTTIALDMSIPFTMARGRNTGWTTLIADHENLDYIQFIDGDCELAPGWLGTAYAALEAHPDWALVCGRRRERFPEASAYNRLADMEWNTPIGEATACGGDMLARVEALRAVGGYNPSLICGEEPEMCIRLRQLGWRIYRLDAEMTAHDAAMLRFRQWWRRSIRGGWAVAEGAALYGRSEGYMVQAQRSGWLWGGFLPGLALLGLGPSQGWTGLIGLLYLWLGWRIYHIRCRDYGDRSDHARLYAVLCLISKPAQLWGQISYSLNRWQKRPAQLIEYKGP